MRIPQIPYLAVVLSICFISCRDTLGEQRDAIQIKTSVPSNDPRPSENPALENDVQNPVETPPEKEPKKGTSRKIDTLKPITAAP